MTEPILGQYPPVKIDSFLADRCGRQDDRPERRVECCLDIRHAFDRFKSALDWRFDQDAIDAEAATDGWYALLTNLPADVTAAQVLARYKNQPAASERRYHDLKGPLAVAPMFLHANRRITAVIGVICMALLIYCLAERQARRNLAPAVRLDGLYAGRPAKPTASLIFTALATLRLRAGTDDGPQQIPQPDPVQQQLLDLLEIDPRKPADSPGPMCEIRV